jgi:hypothetical protein
MLRRYKVRFFFFFKNFIRGLIFFVIAILFYKLIFRYLDLSTVENVFLFNLSSSFVFILFFFSELIFGLIPPELFMIWLISTKSLDLYPYFITILACLSYFAGFIAFMFGKYLHKTWLYETMKKYIIGKYERKINLYGWLVIVVAALTPIPFSATCAVVGAVGFKKNKFLYFALTRFIRYAIYAYLIWLAHPF